SGGRSDLVGSGRIGSDRVGSGPASPAGDRSAGFGGSGRIGSRLARLRSFAGFGGSGRSGSRPRAARSGGVQARRHVSVTKPAFATPIGDSQGRSAHMRLISVASAVLVVLLAFVAGVLAPVTQAGQGPPVNGPHNAANVREGQQIFRFDTFGSEQLWTDTLRLNEKVEEVSPRTALTVGLKVDVEALPPAVIAALEAGQVNLDDPAVTLALLQLDAVAGVRGQVNAAGQVTSLGITCALCHSTVDDSLAPGIGRRLDGWANTDLNVGEIVSLSDVLGEDLKEQFRQWGPGKYDPRHHYFDGENIQILNEPSLPVVIPPIYGLKGVG